MNRSITRALFVVVIALDEMHSSAVFSLPAFLFVTSQLVLELGRVARETSWHRHRRHPSRRGLAQTERRCAGYGYHSWSYWAGIWDIIRRGSQEAFNILHTFLLRVGSDAPDSSTAYYARRVGQTNRQTVMFTITKIETQFYKLRIETQF